jgi:hypothetical protein
MSPTLLARVDGLPAVLLERERIYPAPNGSAGGSRRTLSARERARVERQTAAVHTAELPLALRRELDPISPWARDELDRAGLLAELAQAGLL